MGVVTSISGGGPGGGPGGGSGGAGGIGGSTGATDNTVLRADGAGGATLQSSSTTLSDTGVLSAYRRSVTVKSDDDDATVPSHMYTNGAATDTITLTLPGVPVSGDEFHFAVTAAHSLVVRASGAQVIRVGSSASTAGGTATSSTVGSVLRITFAAANTWIGTLSGTWVFA